MFKVLLTSSYGWGSASSWLNSIWRRWSFRRFSLFLWNSIFLSNLSRGFWWWRSSYCLRRMWRLVYLWLFFWQMMLYLGRFRYRLFGWTEQGLNPALAKIGTRCSQIHLSIQIWWRLNWALDKMHSRTPHFRIPWFLYFANSLSLVIRYIFSWNFNVLWFLISLACRFFLNFAHWICSRCLTLNMLFLSRCLLWFLINLIS